MAGPKVRQHSSIGIANSTPSQSGIGYYSGTAGGQGNRDAKTLDYAVLVLVLPTGTTVTAKPTNATLIRSDTNSTITSYLYGGFGVAGGGFTFSASADFSISWMAFSGVDSTTPVATTALATATTGFSIAASSVTTTAANQFVGSVVAGKRASTTNIVWTGPSQDSSNSGVFSIGDPQSIFSLSTAGAGSLQASAGSSGTRTWTSNVSMVALSAYTFVLNPATTWSTPYLRDKSFSNAGTAAPVTSVAVPAITGLGEDDLMIAILRLPAANTVTLPSGWSTLSIGPHSDGSVTLLAGKITVFSDLASIGSFSFSTSTGYSLMVFAMTYNAPTLSAAIPVIGDWGYASANANLTIPGFTTTEVPSYIMGVIGYTSSTQPAALPSGWQDFEITTPVGYGGSASAGRYWIMTPSSPLQSSAGPISSATQTGITGDSMGAMLAVVSGITQSGTASLSAAASLTVSGTVVGNLQGAAALSASGTLSASGVVSKLGTASLAAASTLTSTGVVSRVGTATLSASATLTPTVLTTQQGAASLSASATLSATGVVSKLGTVAMSGASTLTSTGVVSKVGTASLSATGTLTSAAVISRVGVASLAATATLSATAIATQFSSIPLTAAATLTAVGTVVKLGTVSLTSAATLTATGTRVLPGIASMSSVGTLTTTALVTAQSAAALASSAVLTVAGSATELAAVSVVAAATLSTLAVLMATGTVSMTAAAILTAASIVWRQGTLRPDTILVQTNYTGTLTDIRDDPDADDTVFWDASGTGEIRLGFELPPGNLRPGAGRQEFRILFRPGA